MRIISCVLIALLLAWPPSSSRAKESPPWTLADADLDNARNALYWLGKGSWSNAKIHAGRAKDPLIQELTQWMHYTSHGPDVPFAELTSFLRMHPEWPDQIRLYKNAESNLNPRVAAEDVVLWFSRSVPGAAVPTLEEPLTARGKYYLAKALRGGEAARVGIPASTAERFLREAWVGLDTSDPTEQKFLKEYGEKVSEKEYVERIDRLLWKDKVAAAKALLGKVGKKERKLFETRIKLMRDGAGIDTVLAKLPAHLQEDEGLLYARMAWRARRGKDEGVREALWRVPSNSVYAVRFWPYRELQVRLLLQQKKFQQAYDLVMRHGLKDGADFADAEWLAGWVALRFLDDPKIAYQHFFNLYHGVKTPISLARASYWAGRAAERNANLTIAKKWYVVATKYPGTFYGQLATEKIGGKVLYLPATPKISAQDRAFFSQNRAAKVAYILYRLGNHPPARQFMKAAIREARSPGEMLLVARLGKNILNRLDYGIQAAKEAALEGLILPEHHYPTFAGIGDAIRRIQGHPEMALVHAIILQESLFDTTARSHRGASGLMQLMPPTARMLARQLNARFDRGMLISDPLYNVKLGTLHVRELLTQNRGSYVLSIAGYNAGSGNAAKWIRKYGDPRSMQDMDEVVDWIEMIPFEETRNYVQRVLENLQLYRYVLGGYDQPYVSLAADLWR